MKSVWKRVLSVVMVLCMLVSVAPVTVLAVDAEEPDSAVTAEATEPAVQETVDAELQEPAEEPTVDAEQPEPTEEPVEETEEPAADLPEEPITEDTERSSIDGIYWRNPLYPDQGKSAVKYNSNAGDYINRDLRPADFDIRRGDVVAELRTALVERKTEIYLYYQTNAMLTEEEVFSIFDDAFAETENGQEGDYLYSSVMEYGAAADYILQDGLYYNIIGFGVSYLTTAEQEQEVRYKIGELQNAMNNAKNEYDKVMVIYDYMIENVEYDLDNITDANNYIQHSAYAAAVNGKASAQGVAMLFYRAAKTYGLNSRIIFGTIENVAFAWNIVELYNKWYNVNMSVDCFEDTKECFLKGSTDLELHIRDEYYDSAEFHAAQPMAEVAFDPEKAVSGSEGTMTWNYNALTNTLSFGGTGELLVPHDVHDNHLFDGMPTVVIEGDITSIGENAFYRSTFSVIIFSEGLVTIGEGAFRECHELREISLPNSLQTIGKGAFENTSLTKLHISANVTDFGISQFYDSYHVGKIFEGYTVDENNTAYSSENGMLYNKDKTVLISTPNTETADYTIAKSVTAIGEEAFLGAPNGLRLHEGIVSIGENAFRLAAPTALELPKSLTHIGEGAFVMNDVSSIYIPETVVSIANNAFVYDGDYPDPQAHIPNVYYGGTAEQWAAINIGEENGYLLNAEVKTETYAISGNSWHLDLETGALEVSAPINLYAKNYGWMPWKDEITSITFGERAQYVGRYAFADCENLKVVRFSEDVNTIFEGAFDGCVGVTDIYYPGTMSDWKASGFEEFFADAPNKNVHVESLPVSGSWGEQVTWTYDEATAVLVIRGSGVIEGRETREWEHWVDHVKVAIIEEGITEIGSDAFYGCHNLVRVVIPEGVTAIGQYAFHAANVQDITIPVSLKSVPDQTFTKSGLDMDVHYRGTEAQWNEIEFNTMNEGLTEGNIYFETTCNHEMVMDMGKAATCTEEGRTMSKHCSVCKTVYAEQRVIPKAPHEIRLDYSSFETYVCDNCMLEYEELPAISGEFGDGLTWELNLFDNGLIVSGSGAIPDYADSSETPWSAWTTNIKGVWVKDGVTAIGSHAFSDCVNVESVTIGKDVVSIGAHAFADCVGLDYLELRTATKEIGESAFKGCNWLATVNYIGLEEQWKQLKIADGNEALTNAKINYYKCETHIWDGGTVTKEPTVEEEGEKEFVCQTCGQTKTERISKLPDPSYVNPFTDVSDADYFYLPVQWAVENNVTGGIGNNMFGPHNSCTRGQVVTFLWAAAGKPEPTSKDNPFNDVSEADYYYKPVLWAVENGITGGIGEGLFGPNESCTRGQIVTFLWAAMDKPEVSGTSSFSDVADTDWYAKPILWAAQNDVTGGIGNNQFGPNNTCTRGQVVTFLYKVYNK